MKWPTFILGFVIMVPVLGTPQATSKFPTLSGKTLSGNRINIPHRQHPQLMILGFDMASAVPMESWVRKLNLTPSSNIHWYQIAIIGPVPPFVDGFITRGMKRSIPKNIHPFFFPYFGNKKFAILMAAQGNKTLKNKVPPFIVITRPNGHIQFSEQAEPTTVNVQRIKNIIKTVDIVK
ncbi:MAG: hypothetical protein ACO3K7_02030 [Candidatus Marinamargulisbacteria bacterium]